jgi:hypothetical protein
MHHRPRVSEGRGKKGYNAVVFFCDKATYRVSQAPNRRMMRIDLSPTFDVPSSTRKKVMLQPSSILGILQQCGKFGVEVELKVSILMSSRCY